MTDLEREQYKDKIIKLLEKHLGNATEACKELKISRQTFYNYCKADPEFAERVASIDEITLDLTETALHKAIAKGEVSAIIFKLKTKGKKRGYSDKQEMDINHTHKVILPKKNEND